MQVIICSIIIFCLKINNIYSISRIPSSWLRGNLSSNGVTQQNIISKFNALSGNGNNGNIIDCINKNINKLMTGSCAYLINDIKFKQTDQIYCILNTDGGIINRQNIPSIQEIYLMRYYGISTDSLPKKKILNFNFKTNSDISPIAQIKTDLSINYYNTIIKKLKDNSLNKNDITQGLLKQIGINDDKILSQYLDKYLTNIPITKLDIIKCENETKALLQQCTNSKNINAMNYPIIQNACIKYISTLNDLYKNRLSEVTVNQKNKLKELVIQIHRQN